MGFLSLPLRGLITPIVTPLLDQTTLDVPSIRRIAGRLLSGGVHGIFVLGSTGESSSLSMDNRLVIIDEVCGVVGGRVPVVVNVSDTAHPHCLELVYRAAQTGAAAVAISPPCYYPLDQAALATYIERFALSSPLPVFLYNIPQFAHTEFAVETVGQLAQIRNVVGIKNSNGDLDYLRRVRELTQGREEFTLLVGNEETLLPAIKAGAHGGVCGGANLFPALYTRLYETAANGLDEADQLQALVTRVCDAVYTVGPPETSYFRGLKYALEVLGICSGVVALPQQPFTSDEYNILKGRLNRLLPEVTRVSAPVLKL